MDKLLHSLMLVLAALISGQTQALPTNTVMQLDQKLYTHLDGFWAKGMQFSNLQLENYEFYPIESSAYPSLEADKILRLAAVGGIDYLQVVRGSQLDLVRCDDQACSTIKEQALDLAAIKKGFATHALGANGTIVSWYQHQQNKALTLSVFPITGGEKIIHQGDDGIITAVQQEADQLRAIGSLNDQAVIWQFNSGYQANLLINP